MPPEAFLIAESGATKTTWMAVLEGKAQVLHQGPGLNPNAVAQAVIEKELHILKGKTQQIGPITELFFYSAGLRKEAVREHMRGLMGPYFPQLTVEMYTDLDAAIRSTGRKTGLVGILGTGSNAAFYRAHQLEKSRGGHGYLMGDEGSGMDLGKHLLKAALEGRLEEKAISEFCQLTGEALLATRTKIYQSAKPAFTMAALAPFVKELLHYPTVREMVRERFRLFLTTTFLQMSEARTYPIDLVGGISEHFSAEIRTVMQDLELEIGNFMANPIEGLVQYHLHTSLAR
ncbi:MAG: hypothetical protein AAFR61_19620 [Bacteroidota bacterium]